MYRLSNAAVSDIEDILTWSITGFGMPQTEIYHRGLKHCLSLLDKNPEMGGVADDIRAGYRRFPYESHVIFYLRREYGIFIVRVLHKRMDAVLHLHD